MNESNNNTNHNGNHTTHLENMPTKNNQEKWATNVLTCMNKTEWKEEKAFH